MYTGYAMKCRFPDVGIIRNALVDVATIAVIEPSDLPQINPPPDLLFYGWGSAHGSWQDNDEEEQRMKAIATDCLHLRKARNQLEFRDIPILVVTEDPHGSEALMMASQFGATGFLPSPLDGEKIREVVLDSMRPVGKETPIDVRIINPFMESVLLTLEQMAQIRVERKSVYLKRNYQTLGDISAIMSIMGSGFEGSVGLTFQEDLAREVVGKMWKTPPQEISREKLNDGLGELVNVICGQATSRLTQKNDYNFAFAVPTIVNGFGHSISHETNAPCLVITFQSGNLYFAVQLAIRRMSDPAIPGTEER